MGKKMLDFGGDPFLSFSSKELIIVVRLYGTNKPSFQSSNQ